jgi:hypothetical protein
LHSLIHPDDARRAGVTDGARVTSSAGSSSSPPRSATMMPGVVSLPHG